MKKSMDTMSSDTMEATETIISAELPSYNHHDTMQDGKKPVHAPMTTDANDKFAGCVSINMILMSYADKECRFRARQMMNTLL